VNNAPPPLVDTPAAWRAVAADVVRAGRLAVDLEADGFYRYPEHLSLIQLALPDGRVFLLDPLAVPDPAPLGDVLADPATTKVFHSADYDLRSLDRDFGFRVSGLFDTAIAAQFLGSARTGLANVLAEYTGIDLPKPKRLQRMDWSQRPLDAEALTYAADDVVHLLGLADTLAGALAALGRTSWAAEECRRLEGVRFQAPDPPEQAFLAVSGARDLTDGARAVLREIYVWRESEARRTGRPPFMLLSNQALLALAAAPEARVDRLRGVNRAWLSGSGRALEAALARGRAAAGVPWPRRPRGPEWTPHTQARLKHLKAWRTDEAARLALEAGTVWSAEHLKHVALHPDGASRALDTGEPPWVRQWQWGELGPSLERARSAMGDAGAAPPAPSA
jgi:ribonuclease D